MNGEKEKKKRGKWFILLLCSLASPKESERDNPTKQKFSKNYSKTPPSERFLRNANNHPERSYPERSYPE